MDKIGKYEIREVIGRGGMGTVYRARDTVIGRDVAIKVIADHVASHANVKERLYQEATSAGRLSHEHIMTIFDVGEIEGKPYLVMELLDGIDLRSASDGGKRLSLDQKLEIALQIGRGLAYAHARGVVHRDIKPENIRILPSGRAKILDFGIARVESETRTITHSSIGTPRYMSPEQVKGQKIDHRTDIFSFGVVLYELLSGINPFDGSHVTAVIYKILHEEPEPVKIDDDLLSADLQRIVARCLEKDVDMRYPDFTTVIRDLERVVSRRRSDAPTVLDQRFADDLHEADRSPAAPSEDRSDEQAAAAAAGVRDASANRPHEHPVAARSSDGLDRGAASRKWLFGVAVLVIAGLAIGGYYAFRSGTSTEPSPSSSVSTAAGTTSEDELAALLQDVVRLREEMQAAKDLAEPFQETQGLSGLYDEALQQETSAVTALTERTAESYRRAAGAFTMAKNTFRAVAIAGDSDAESLRGQAESARQAADRARRTVAAEMDSPVISDVIARAESAARRGRDQLGSGDYTAALASFGQAESGYQEARRALDRAAAVDEARSSAESARASMETRRTAAAPWGDHPTNADAYERAEELRREGIQLMSEGRHADAAARFGQAGTAYAEVREPEEIEPAVTQTEADEARAAMLGSKGSIPEALRGHERFLEGASLERQAGEAYADSDFEQAVELYGRARTLFAAVASLPPPKTAEEEVEEALVPLLNRFKQSLETKDAAGLRQIHSFLGAYSAMFDVAEDIEVALDYSDVNVSNTQATVAVSLDMTYKNRTQRMRSENQVVALRWTLQDEGNGRWRLEEVARQ